MAQSEPIDNLAWEYLMAAQKAGMGLRDAVLTVLRLAQGGGRTATDTVGGAVRGLGRAVGSAGRSAVNSLDHSVGSVGQRARSAGRSAVNSLDNAVGSIRQGARSAGRNARYRTARGFQRAAHLIQPYQPLEVIQSDAYQSPPQASQLSEDQPQLQTPGWLWRNARQARRRSAQKLRGFAKYLRSQPHRDELYMASDPHRYRNEEPEFDTTSDTQQHRNEEPDFNPALNTQNLRAPLQQFSLASDNLADDGLDYQI